jgi:hypothetical protein
LGDDLHGRIGFSDLCHKEGILARRTLTDSTAGAMTFRRLAYGLSGTVRRSINRTT